jgi:hypothetical protein
VVLFPPFVSFGQVFRTVTIACGLSSGMGTTQVPGTDPVGSNGFDSAPGLPTSARKR